MGVTLRTICESGEEEAHSLFLWLAWPQKMQHINSKCPDFPLAALLM